MCYFAGEIHSHQHRDPSLSFSLSLRTISISIPDIDSDQIMNICRRRFCFIVGPVSGVRENRLVSY